MPSDSKLLPKIKASYICFVTSSIDLMFGTAKWSSDSNGIRLDMCHVVVTLLDVMQSCLYIHTYCIYDPYDSLNQKVAWLDIHCVPIPSHTPHHCDHFHQPFKTFQNHMAFTF